MSEQLTIEQRVANGAAWLDENRPGWLGDIDVNRIDISSGCNCILGQAFGHYSDSPEEARWDDGFIAADRGFIAAGVHSLVADDEEALADEWRRVISARRETAADLKARSGAATDA